MKLLKFGGSSVGTPVAIKGLLEILIAYQQRGDRFAVVFSAFSKVTDALIDMAQKAGQGDAAYRTQLEAVYLRHQQAVDALLQPENRSELHTLLDANFEALGDVLHGIYLLREVSARSLDFVVSFGERNSTLIIAHAMRAAGLDADFLDARTIIRTDAQFGNAKVDFETTNALIQQWFSEHSNIQAVTGFIGSTSDGITTTLGRGGSDYTASILGAALDASCIEIWTDVNGVLTADPRLVKKAFTIPSMTYREAMEMSHFGAKVIYPPTILPALAKEIPLLIKNTFNPGFAGTRITREAEPSDFPVKGISSINQVCLLTLQGSGLFGVPGVAGRLFGALAQAGINVVIITQGSSESSITFAVAPGQAQRAQAVVETAFVYDLQRGLIEPLRVENNLSVLAVVGENMRYRPGVAGQLFQALGHNGVNIVAIAQGSSELNVSVVLNAVDETKALNAIHEAFFLSDTKTLHLYMVGVGLIGSTLLRQINQNAAYLRENRHIEIRVIGLANSRKMYFSETGIPFEQFKENLDDSTTPFSMPQFVAQMKALNLSNAVFVDCTASEQISDYYEQILGANISISTPNKIAASSPFVRYKGLKQISNSRSAYWRYETNVGAGLPIISTLNDLIQSGDRIKKIEGVLSGTLSYIFNNFNTSIKFSEVVKKAKALGLTEPDPRDDLSGSDVRRKLLILARESGLALESADIELESLLPDACVNAPSVPAFMEALERHNPYYENLSRKAEAKGKVLRYVAKLEDDRATVVLEAFGQDHPFYFLSGSDNMVVFTTERYHERPLVVRGPGAGAEVTAAGVFAELIKMIG